MLEALGIVQDPEHLLEQLDINSIGEMLCIPWLQEYNETRRSNREKEVTRIDGHDNKKHTLAHTHKHSRKIFRTRTHDGLPADCFASGESYNTHIRTCEP
jgi:hypothetical protein